MLAKEDASRLLGVDVGFFLCEALFIRSPFHNRCKPGLSHWRFGLQLRRASAEAHARRNARPRDVLIFIAFPTAPNQYGP